MCGVLFTHNKQRKGTGHMKSMFKAQAERGIEGFGAVVADKKIKKVLRTTESDEMFEALQPLQAQTVLFHHRYPTSTENLVEATHPIAVHIPKTEHRYFIIHNGVITNHAALYEQHKRKGYKYSTELRETTLIETASGTQYTLENDVKYNDSEALAYDLAEIFEGRKDTLTARGSIAYIAMQTDMKNNVLRIIYGRNGDSPLFVRRTNKSFVLASTFTAIDKVFTGEAKIEPVTQDCMTTYDIRDGKEITTYLDMNGYQYRHSSSFGYGSSSTKSYTDSVKEIEDEKKDAGDVASDIVRTDYSEEEREAYTELFDDFDFWSEAEMKARLTTEQNNLYLDLEVNEEDGEKWQRLALVEKKLEVLTKAYKLWSAYASYEGQDVTTIQALPFSDSK